MFYYVLIPGVEDKHNDKKKKYMLNNTNKYMVCLAKKKF